MTFYLIFRFFFKYLFTRNGIWCSQYDSDTNHQSKQWTIKCSLRRKKRSVSQIKTTLTCFFRPCYVLIRLRDTVRKNSPNFGGIAWFLHYDSALTIRYFLRKNRKAEPYIHTLWHLVFPKNENLNKTTLISWYFWYLKACGQNSEEHSKNVVSYNIAQ